MNDTPMIYSALTTAAAAINAVGKDSRNTAQGWNFRSIDAVYNALNPALIAAGITIVPELVDKDITTDGKATTARLTMKYTAYAQDGSSVSAVVIGEGKDFSDKACNKAMAIAYKYMAFQLFCIPTEEMRRDDPDFYVPDEPVETVKVEKNTKGKPEKAANVAMTKCKPERLKLWNDCARDLGLNAEQMKKARADLVASGQIADKASNDMSDAEYAEMMAMIVANVKK